MFSSTTLLPPRRGPPRHNFVVSAITFEGFNYVLQTWHALFIQIYRDEFDNWHCRPIQNGHRRPFCQQIWHTQKSCVSIWKILQPFCQQILTKIKGAYWSEMARNEIESEFRTSKICIDLKWPEMWSKVNFGHPKWPTAAIL